MPATTVLRRAKSAKPGRSLRLRPFAQPGRPSSTTSEATAATEVEAVTAAAAVAAMRAAEVRVMDVGAETVASAEAARLRAWLRAGRAAEQVGKSKAG